MPTMYGLSSQEWPDIGFELGEKAPIRATCTHAVSAVAAGVDDKAWVRKPGAQCRHAKETGSKELHIVVLIVATAELC